MRQGRSVAPKCSVVRRATVLFISLAGAAWGCASFGTAASDVPLDSGVEAAASEQPEASVDAGQPEAGGRCGFAVDDGFDSDKIDSAWSVTQHGRSRIVTSEVFKKAGAKSLQLSVASTANDADTQAGYLRRGLGGASCLALDFWLKVQDDARATCSSHWSADRESEKWSRVVDQGLIKRRPPPGESCSSCAA